MRILLLGLLLAACGDSGGGTDPDGANHPAIDAPAHLDAPRHDAPDRCAHHVTLFLNKDGGAYAPGQDDARANTSTILAGAATVAPYPGADWAAVKACVTGALAAYPVDVTDVDPGNAPHVELVFTDRVPGLPTVTGIAPQACGAHGAANGIAWIAGSVGTGANYHCGVALGLYGLLETLDYTTDATDFMSFNVCSSGTAGCAFANRDETCGFSAAHPCTCTQAAKENPSTALLAALPCD